MESDNRSLINLFIFFFFCQRAAREKAKAKEQQKRVAKVI